MEEVPSDQDELNDFCYKLYQHKVCGMNTHTHSFS